MTAETAADLRAAAEVLKRDGWTQGVFHRRIGDSICHCAEGAIGVATGKQYALTFDPRVIGEVDWRVDEADDKGDRHDAAVDYLGTFLERFGGGSVPDWNDAPGRTADEVIAALEAAADAAEATP